MLADLRWALQLAPQDARVHAFIEKLYECRTLEALTLALIISLTGNLHHQNRGKPLDGYLTGRNLCMRSPAKTSPV